MIRIIYSVAILLINLSVTAQKTKPDNWYLFDPKADKIYGAGIEEAYKTLGDRKSKKIIVAVIDSGVDIEHEDLKDVIWINKGEIPDNGIDDDGNGYIDDVYGWSFIGGATEDINYEATELARIYQKLAKKYKGLQEYEVTDKNEYKYWQTIQAEFIEDMTKTDQQYQTVEFLVDYIKRVEKQTGQPISMESNKSFTPENDIDIQIKNIMANSVLDKKDNSGLLKDLEHAAESYAGMLVYNMLNSDSLRIAVVGDNPNDPNERYYGCNRVKGPDAMHGTHVSGIIAANRNNNLGIIGEANNVEIMAIRAVPNGDERDKDIANAILYAVDNGASIINMSFGKYYTPNKGVVDKAIKYAQSKDVLLVHAAGNDAKNKDVEESYPSRELEGGEIADNWIEVGANSYKKGKGIIASFSNYGAKRVDLFGPGVGIYSTVPDSKYEDASGTSMACPSVAGVAAIIRSYFPELTAPEVKQLLMETVVPYKGKVYRPGAEEVETKKGPKSKLVKTTIPEICISGGFVNANNAVKHLIEQGK